MKLSTSSRNATIRLLGLSTFYHHKSDKSVTTNDKGKFEICILLVICISLFLRYLEAANLNTEMLVIGRFFLHRSSQSKLHGKSKRTRERGELFMEFYYFYNQSAHPLSSAVACRFE
jgi:hypothetical protein